MCTGGKGHHDRWYMCVHTHSTQMHHVRDTTIYDKAINNEEKALKEHTHRWQKWGAPGHVSPLANFQSFCAPSWNYEPHPLSKALGEYLSNHVVPMTLEQWLKRGMYAETRWQQYRISLNPSLWLCKMSAFSNSNYRMNYYFRQRICPPENISSSASPDLGNASSFTHPWIWLSKKKNQGRLGNCAEVGGSARRRSPFPYHLLYE